MILSRGWCWFCWRSWDEVDFCFTVFFAWLDISFGNWCWQWTPLGWANSHRWTQDWRMSWIIQIYYNSTALYDQISFVMKEFMLIHSTSFDSHWSSLLAWFSFSHLRVLRILRPNARRADRISILLLYHSLH